MNCNKIPNLVEFNEQSLFIINVMLRFLSLTFFILMDFSKHIDTISMELSILCFKGSEVEFTK